MFFSDLIDFIVLFSIIIPLVCIGQILTLARAYRRNFRLAIHPTIVPTVDETMNPFLREHLGRFTIALRSLGFHATSNGHATFGPLVTWTHVLFTHPQFHHRCSVLCLVDRHRRVAEVNCVFASEAQDGTVAKTDLYSSTQQPNVPRSASDISSAETVAAAYQAHLIRVSETLQGKCPDPIPEPHLAFDWLTARAAAVTRSIAKEKQFQISRNRLWYIPKWNVAVSSTWRCAFPFRLFRRRTLAAPAFEVLLPTSPVSSSNG